MVLFHFIPKNLRILCGIIYNILGMYVSSITSNGVCGNQSLLFTDFGNRLRFALIDITEQYVRIPSKQSKDINYSVNTITIQV